MAGLRTVGKAQLVAEIDKTWGLLRSFLAGLTEEQMTSIPDHAGWTVKDHISHLVAWEQSIVALFQGSPRHVGLGIEESLFVGGSFDEMNAAIYALRRDIPLEEALSQLQATHEQLLVLANPLSDEQINQPARQFFRHAPSGDERSVAELMLNNTADHFAEHLRWIKALCEGSS